jgi:heat shock protein HslJ
MLKKQIVTILTLVVAILLLAACSSGSSADGLQEVPVEEIQDITWEWVELVENNPAAQSVVPDPENYTLTFSTDGTVAVKVDCNTGSGSYTIDGSKIEFGPMALTMAMCPPESLHDQFLMLLGDVDTFGMQDDQLVFTLKDDAGEMRFQNAG